MANSPYLKRPKRSFWRTAVLQGNSRCPPEIYAKKWSISPSDRVATAGSCFAQHIGDSLKASGFNVLDAELPPAHLPKHIAKEFGFSLYSARYGNVYTSRQLLQLAQEAFGLKVIPTVAWTNPDGRFFDAFRPSVEPRGLDSVDEVRRHRDHHLKKVRQVLETCDVFVFTFGLTEVWQERETGLVFPTAPGTIAGDYDPTTFEFRNLHYEDVVADFLEFRRIMIAYRTNRNMLRFLITVSPVPLAATATADHVMPATVHSKAILRAAAGRLSADFQDIDYFPSYELISNPWIDECHFESDLRSVKASSVAMVMETFLKAHTLGEELGEREIIEQVPQLAEAQVDEESLPADSVVCEEALLGAFADAAVAVEDRKI